MRRAGLWPALLTVATACGSPPTGPTPPPVPQLSVTCPSTVDASSLGGEPVAVSYGTAQATGGVAPVSVTCSPAADSLFPAGTTTVTCNAADSAGRQASCTFSVRVAAIPKLLQTRFMAFGDSLTEGKLSAARLLFDAGPQAYPFQLKRLLEERYTGQTIDVMNEGHGGEVVSDDGTFPRFVAALEADRPGAVLLMHGVNRLEEETIDEFGNKLEDLVQYARGANVTVFLATLPPLDGPGAGCPECVRPLNEDIHGIAARHGAVLVDVYGAFSGGSALMGADGIHPTAAGYEAIAHAFFDAIRQTLEAPPAIR